MSNIIDIQKEERYNVWNMPKEYFLLEEIYEQFDRFNVYDAELSPGYEYYVASFVSTKEDGTIENVTFISTEFKKDNYE